MANGEVVCAKPGGLTRAAVLASANLQAGAEGVRPS